MKKVLFAVLAVLVATAGLIAGGSYETLFKKKLVKNDVVTTNVIPIAGVDSIHILFKTSDVSKVVLQVAYLSTPTATASFADLDSVGYAAGTKVSSIGFDNQYSGYHGVKFRFQVDSVKTAGSTFEAHRTIEN